MKKVNRFLLVGYKSVYRFLKKLNSAVDGRYDWRILFTFCKFCFIYHMFIYEKYLRHLFLYLLNFYYFLL